MDLDCKKVVILKLACPGVGPGIGNPERKGIIVDSRFRGNDISISYFAKVE